MKKGYITSTLMSNYQQAIFKYNQFNKTKLLKSLLLFIIAGVYRRERRQF